MQARSTFDWRTLGWLILSAVGGMMGLSAAALLVFLGFFSLTMPTEEANAGMILNLAWAAGLVGLLCLPAGYLALRRLLGRAAPGTVVHSNKTHLVVTIAMITLPLWFGLAALASRSGISWLIMPPLLLVLILLPLAWFLSAGARGLPVSADRAWKLGSFSLAITMPLTLIAELVLLLALLVGWGLWIASQPDLLNQFWNFSTQFQQLTDPMEIQTELVNLLHQPGVIPGVLVILGFITPLLEELLKPLAILVFWNKHLTPRNGFLAGMVCGAAFAMLESLNAMSAITDPTWLALAFGRIGTSLLHVVTSGLVGWGMGWAASQKRPGKLLAALAAAVALHGVWNVFSILQGVSSLVDIAPFTQLGRFGPFVLGGLAVLNLGILWWMNRRLRLADDTPLVVSSGALEMTKEE
ncbi:MAG TPA: PrsW family glutamic-type intramembrane protease [Anaerolineaceae bacterium]|nr:PrsW family intramembrane metalloprotease [Chloroflexota bacterium]HOU44018.1 PrsW family glutamic-type intramembrane protease [Anaerolineaceae bacterium]HPA33145.1 PrsW family glutamic-type intramembrane protease [Anaerolineaceae bacterium]HQF46102.1 PrsW family glutamic-type intramembrane protease [Anaerolineaceae bacterium]HQH36131.1 PrsW family glutamic-type intramembrane protease [Anaerolineaceae bacterium]